MVVNKSFKKIPRTDRSQGSHIIGVEIQNRERGKDCSAVDDSILQCRHRRARNKYPASPPPSSISHRLAGYTAPQHLQRYQAMQRGVKEQTFWWQDVQRKRRPLRNKRPATPLTQFTPYDTRDRRKLRSPFLVKSSPMNAEQKNGLFAYLTKKSCSRPSTKLSSEHLSPRYLPAPATLARLIA